MSLSPAELYIPGETTVPFQCTPGAQEEIVATVLRKVFAGLSVLGSGFIIAQLVQKWRRAPTSIDPYCRIMLGLSVYDIIWSFFPWFMGSWLMPAETGHWGASGNTQTCSLQGFFFWLGVPGAQYYQILLSLHTLVLVAFGWKPSDFHRRVEKYAHGAIFFVSLTLASIPLFFQGYNPECGTCLPAPLPIWCGDWIFWGDGETECLRGSPMLSQSYYTIYLTNISIMGVFCSYAMIHVYWTVRRQEIRNSRYAFQATPNQRQKSRRIRRTMILYTFGFYLCWIVPSFIIHFAQQGTPLMRMSYILLPFQGFFNMIIFLAPKCTKYQSDHPGTWLIMAYVYVLFGTFSSKLSRRVGSRVNALRRSSSRIRNPFQISFSGRSGLFNQTLATELNMTGAEELDPFYDEDDGLGFNGFNEDPIPPPRQRSVGANIMMASVKEEPEVRDLSSAPIIKDKEKSSSSQWNCDSEEVNKKEPPTERTLEASSYRTDVSSYPIPEQAQAQEGLEDKQEDKVSEDYTANISIDPVIVEEDIAGDDEEDDNSSEKDSPEAAGCSGNETMEEKQMDPEERNHETTMECTTQMSASAVRKEEEQEENVEWCNSSETNSGDAAVALVQEQPEEQDNDLNENERKPAPEETNEEQNGEHTTAISKDPAQEKEGS